MTKLFMPISALLLLTFLTGFGGDRYNKEAKASAWTQGQGIYGFGPTAFEVSGNNIVAGTSDALLSRAYVFVSADTGLTWALQGSFPVINHNPYTHLYRIPMVGFIQDGSCLFTGFGEVSGHTIYESTDDGLSWVDRDTSFVRQANCFATIDSSVYVGTDTGVFVSTDEGKSWNPTNLVQLSLPISSLTSLGSFLFAGTWAAGVYISQNGGKDWSATSDTSSDVFALATLGNIVFAGANFDSSHGGGLFISRDSGATWIRTSLPGSTLESMSVSKTGVFASTDTAIVMSADSGKTWQIIPTDLTVKAVIALMGDGRYLFAGSNVGASWRATLSGLTGIDRSPGNAPSRFTLYQNYPNPFNPTTVIQYHLPSPCFVTLIVYDVLGRRIATLVEKNQRAGTHTVTFNGNRLSSGIYFYSLKAGNVVRTKKLIILK